MDGRSHAACGPAAPTLHSPTSVLSSRTAMEPEVEDVSIASIFRVHLIFLRCHGRLGMTDAANYQKNFSSDRL